MKKHLSRLVAAILLLSIFASLPLAAFADAGINNVINGSGGAPISAAAAGKNLFFSASNAKNVDQPNASDYYSTPFSMYVNAPMEHSVYTYDTWAARDPDILGAAYHGSRVTVIASHGQFYCILYYTEKYTLKVAWVTAENLSSWYPGKTGSIGRASSRSSYNAGDPVQKWSKEYFVGTRRKFTVLKTPIQDCTGFTLDYQVIARNGASTKSILGPRNVYVNDGNGWNYVGYFDYKTISSCHITVSFSSPITLAAVATIADCAEPEAFGFRQSVIDVQCCY